MALAHPVRIPVFGEIWSYRWACYGVGRSSRRRSTQLSARLSRRPVTPRRSSRVPKLTATALLAMSLTVYQRPTIQHPSLATSVRQTGDVTAVKIAAAWASCCISRAGTSAGWIVEKVILCITCTPNFTVRFWGNNCVLSPRFYGNGSYGVGCRQQRHSNLPAC